MMVEIATKSRHLASLCELDIHIRLSAGMYSYFIPVSLLHSILYETGGKGNKVTAIAW